MRIQDNHIRYILGILNRDAEVVRCREKFYLGLGLSPASLEDLKRLISINQYGSFEFLKQAIVDWMKNSKEATMEALITILSREGFNWSAGELEALVPELDHLLEETKTDRIVMIVNNFDLLCKETRLNALLLMMCREDGLMTTEEMSVIMNDVGSDGKDINSCFYQIVLNAVEKDPTNLDKLVARMSEELTKQSKIVLDILR